MLLGSFVSKTFQKNLFVEVSVAVVGFHFFSCTSGSPLISDLRALMYSRLVI